MALGKNLQIDKLIPEGKQQHNREEVAKVDIPEQNQPNTQVSEDENEPFKVIIIQSLRKKVKKAKVQIEGDLSISNIKKVKNKILPILDVFDIIEFNLCNIDDIDISSLQLVLAAKSYLTKMEKGVTLKTTISENKKNILKNSGLYPLINN